MVYTMIYTMIHSTLPYSDSTTLKSAPGSMLQPTATASYCLTLHNGVSCNIMHISTEAGRLHCPSRCCRIQVLSLVLVARELQGLFLAVLAGVGTSRLHAGVSLFCLLLFPVLRIVLGRESQIPGWHIALDVPDEVFVGNLGQNT
jgi:hypothetical protein